MPIAHPATAPDAAHGAVSAHLSEIEAHLAELDAALASGDANRIERQSQVLQMGLAKALSAFFWNAWQGALLRMKVTHDAKPLRECLRLMLDHFFQPTVAARLA